MHDMQATRDANAGCLLSVAAVFRVVTADELQSVWSASWNDRPSSGSWTRTAEKPKTKASLRSMRVTSRRVRGDRDRSAHRPGAWLQGGGHFGIIRWAVSEARDRIYGFGHAQEVMRQLPPVFCRTKVHIALASFSGLPLAL
jgi:hypothetical protein